MSFVVRAVVATCLAALICAKPNYGFYTTWMNYDPQDSDQIFEQAQVTLFTAATSGFAWALVIAFAMGLYLDDVRVAVLGGVAVALSCAAAGSLIALPARDSRRLAIERLGDGANPEEPLYRLLLLFAVLLVATVLMAVAGCSVGAVPRWAAVVAGVVLLFGMVSTAFTGDPGGEVWWYPGTVAALLPPAGVAPLVVATAQHNDAALWAAVVVGGAALWAGVPSVVRQVRARSKQTDTSEPT